MKKKIGNIILAVALVISIVGNVYLTSRLRQDDDFWCVDFSDTNTRETYATMHNLKEAQAVSTGTGVKVGILDWCFGYEDHEGLYAGGKDFTTYSHHEREFNHASEHGYWMAQTLKEIAPDVEIYALGTYSPENEAEWVDAMIEGIKWAMQNDIDILTLSHEPISEENRDRFDQVVNEAISQGIVTTFIHYDNPANILPWGIWNYQREVMGGEDLYNRDADVNIFQYDYNTLFLQDYKEKFEREDFDSVYKRELFTSVSSMSVVTAGFVAILMSINDSLTPAQYKEILVATSHPAEYEGESAPHVVDIGKAVQYLQDHFPTNS